MVYILLITGYYDLTKNSILFAGLNNFLPEFAFYPFYLFACLIALLVGLILLIFALKSRCAAIHKNNIVIANDIVEVSNQIKIFQLQNNSLEKTESQLKEINATKDRFFSIISHDLRGPLNSITGLLQIVIGYADSFSKEELQDFANNMDKSVRNSLDLLQNLLRWSYTQTGNIEYRPQKTELYKVITSTVNLLEVAASNKNIRISVDIDKSVIVYADADMLSFILRNLIHNAIKFTYTGGLVNLYARLKEKEVEILVSDNGKGMSQQDVHKLFKIDTCYTTNGTAKEIGTGLGLILCNEFVEKNGGKIFVESELKKGTTFRFTLPLLSQSTSRLKAVKSS